jgi:ABC-type nitrate/sulfonate/bicarbonate transport system substrate-binding protein
MAIERIDRSRRRLLALGAGLATTPLLAASQGARAADAPPSRAGALTMGLLRNPVSGLITATDHRGWFRDAGLAYSSVLFAGAGGPKVIQAMGGGNIDLGSVSVTAALLAIGSGGVPLSIVSFSTDPAPAFVLIAAPSIRTVPDLKGKRVATTAGTGLQYFLARALGKHGLTLNDVEFVNLPVGDAQSAFLAGRVDAVVPSLNGRYYIRGIRKDAHELFTWQDFGKAPGTAVRFEDYDVFIAPRSVVAEKRDALRAFLAAYHGKAVPWLLDRATHDAAVAEITRYVNAEQKTPADESAMRQQLEASRFFDLAQVRGIMQSATFRAGLEDQVRFFADAKKLPANLSLDGVIAADLLA